MKNKRKYIKNKQAGKMVFFQDGKESLLPYLNLWRAVINYQIREYIFSSDADKIKNKNQIIEWVFGPYRQDFELVCSLARLEVSYVRKIIKTLIATENETHKKIVKTISKKSNFNIFDHKYHKINENEWISSNYIQKK
ncbi:MAG: hypothetical protein J0H68_00190 [Sphingobacteriia bacterium]|nr:hypothetical protein [Sphingobacteriia bacterium]